MKLLKLCAILAVVSACTPPVVENPVSEIGDFALGYNFVQGDDMVKGPLSRDGDPKVISAAVQEALDKRLMRYQGDKRYHVVTRIDAYTLGRMGIPFVFSPQTALVLTVSVWDDAAQKRINEKPVQLVVLENTNKSNLLGSGIGQTRDQQIASIAESAAYQIEDFLIKQHQENGWFDPNVTLDLFDIIADNKAKKDAEDNAALMAQTPPVPAE